VKKESYILILFLLLGFVAFAFKRKKKMPKEFADIVFNPTVRPCDRNHMGCGYYNASRVGHIHHGVDIIANVGENVYAPISGSVRRLTVYPDTDLMKGIEITNDKYAVKIFYLDSPLLTNEFVEKGQKIGVAENVAKYHDAEGLMTNHVHVEVRKNGKLINPTTLLI
jgi:murein DD-endopeptidase MepM/ murein hydrolase activator NlpD